MNALGMAKKVLLTPIWTAAILTGAKSFRSNPVLASPRLNRMGLHRFRLERAAAMSAYRRRRLAHLLSETHVAAFERDGYVVIKDVLPSQEFAALSQAVENTAFPAHENRQGDTLNRFCGLPPEIVATIPELQRLLANPLFNALLRYAASFNHVPMFNLNTVITVPGTGAHDPNTVFHSDTFHAVGKGWFFLRDVEMADGPFSFVPGSHKLTPARIEWEQDLSQRAARDADPLNTIGSFRVTSAEIAAMGYGEAVPFPVPANSLVVADTHGFHARALSTRPSVRLAVYGSLRSNPFMPLTGVDLFQLPGLKGRKSDAINLARAIAAKASGRRLDQPPVGLVRPGDPALR